MKLFQFTFFLIVSMAILFVTLPSRASNPRIEERCNEQGRCTVCKITITESGKPTIRQTKRCCPQGRTMVCKTSDY